jgi:ClpP class serine protease
MSFRALEAAENVVWAMETHALEGLLAIAAREHETTPEALEAYRAKSVAQADQMRVRDGVAIISANGPMFKRANLMTAMSGATSYEIMRRDLQLAVDQKLKGAILNLDTPGGEASGAGELAAYIASLRGKFPVVAYVNGMACSAGFWVAAPCAEIVIDAQAVLGSIGVQWAMRSRDEPKGVTTHTFISSQSPLKNPDPGSKDGAAHFQSVVDAMAQVFVEAVATYRGRDIETVLSNFGKGGILVGVEAVNAGLADRLGNFEGVLAELSAGSRKTRTTGAKMSDESISRADMNAAIATAVAEATASANARYAGINRIAAGFGLDAATVSAAISAGATVEAFALEQADKAAAARVAAAAQAAQEAEQAAAAAAANPQKTPAASALAALKTDEEAAAAVAAASAAAEGEDMVDTIAARIAAA